ncbi:MAG: hypothetical protein AAB263_02345 [Planctomycetota bacterium]
MYPCSLAKSWLISCIITAAVHAANAPSPAADLGLGHPETCVLYHVNRLRTEFTYEDKSVQRVFHNKRFSDRTFEGLWYRVSEAALDVRWSKRCPLIPHPALMATARSLLASGQTATKEQAFDATTAVAASGYVATGPLTLPTSPYPEVFILYGPATKTAIALIGTPCPDAESAYVAAMANVISALKTPGRTETEPIFATRTLGLGPWTDIGIATATDKAGTKVVIVLGKGSTTSRPIGGIVYEDLNNNGSFDPGEGVAGVPVVSGTAKDVSGPGGAWRLETDPTKPAEVTIGAETLSITRPVAADSTTMYLLWRMPSKAQLKELDALIANVVKTASVPDEEKRVGPQSELLRATRMLDLDDARTAKINQLTEPVQIRYELMREHVLAALSSEPKEALKEIDTQKKRWNGALAGFFREATQLVPLRQQVITLLGAATAANLPLITATIAQLKKSVGTSSDRTFKSMYLDWIANLETAEQTAKGPDAGKGKKP